MRAFLDLDYERNPDLGSKPGRAEDIAKLFGSTKNTINTLWSKMRKGANDLKHEKWDADQIKILEEAYENDKNFKVKSVIEKLGLDPTNKKHAKRINNWRVTMQRRAQRANEGEDQQPGTSNN